MITFIDYFAESKTISTVYTPWRNLKKTADMDIGAIGFHDNSQVRSLRVEKNNATVKQLEKTKKVILFSS